MVAFEVNPSPGFRDHPEHTITVEPFGGVVNVTFGEVMIASSDRARLLREKGHDPVLYLPFEDIYFVHLEKTATTTHCPFKGDASYWSVTGQDEAAKDVMWAYQHPYDEMLEIKDHGAFYPDRVVIDAGEERRTQ
ncbi:MAG: DUF427 domain-containing protein [Hyphomicrobiales bacterium]|nr:DUF427 domain-containing protein [Hyphomicrobiales bacterium]